MVNVQELGSKVLKNSPFTWVLTVVSLFHQDKPSSLWQQTWMCRATSSSISKPIKCSLKTTAFWYSFGWEQVQNKVNLKRFRLFQWLCFHFAWPSCHCRAVYVRLKCMRFISYSIFTFFLQSDFTVQLCTYRIKVFQMSTTCQGITWVWWCKPFVRSGNKCDLTFGWLQISRAIVIENDLYFGTFMDIILDHNFHCQIWEVSMFIPKFLIT